MSTSKKGDAEKFLEKLMGGRLSFGRMIESLRLADEVSQVDLAKKMRISRAYLCDIEKGRRMVSIERAAKFAKVMGYSVNQFIGVAIEDQLREIGMNARVTLEVA